MSTIYTTEANKHKQKPMSQLQFISVRTERSSQYLMLLVFCFILSFCTFVFVCVRVCMCKHAYVHACVHVCDEIHTSKGSYEMGTINNVYCYYYISTQHLNNILREKSWGEKLFSFKKHTYGTSGQITPHLNTQFM